MGIHYDYKSKRGERAMLKEAKRKARLEQRKARRSLKSKVEEPEEITKEEEPTKEDKVNPQTPVVAPVMVRDNHETSIKGNLEQSAVNKILFSEMNMKVLQDAIEYGVYQRTGILVGKQSPNELMIIVRSIMYQYANFQTSPESVLEEVKRLNVKILLYCIENVSSNALQRQQYLRDLEKLPTPIDRPSYLDKPNNYTYDISNLLKRD